MPIYTIRASWEDDDSIQRDIEILSAQTFMELHTCIKQAFQIKENIEGSFFVSDDYWSRGKEISSTVLKNIKDAPALSCTRTSVGALVREPHQRFVYSSASPKKWQFLLEIIEIHKEDISQKTLPALVRSEGISPEQIGKHGKGKKGAKGEKGEKDIILEIEEKYDLESQDGFGNEGEDDDEGGSSFSIEGGEDSNEMFNADEEMY